MSAQNNENVLNIDLSKYSNYRYNRIGGIDADRDFDGEIVPYTLTKAEVDAVITRNISVAAYAAVVQIPDKITRRQAKQQLLIAGLLHLVQPAIDAIADPMQRELAQIYWTESNDFERNNPFLIQLARTIGITDSQLDQLFIEASKL